MSIGFKKKHGIIEKPKVSHVFFFFEKVNKI